ncbi:MAG: phage neck terminator protein [Terriglobales bacterium]
MSATPTPLEFACITWCKAILPGVTPLWQRQDIGQQARPFVLLSHLAEASDASLDEERAMGADTYSETHRREATIQVWLESNDVTGAASARSLAKTLRDSIRKQATLDAFAPADAVILDAQPVIDHEHLHETRFYGQSTFDIRVRYTTSDAETIGGISTVKFIPPPTWTEPD